jgi:hypothetical protein
MNYKLISMRKPNTLHPFHIEGLREDDCLPLCVLGALKETSVWITGADLVHEKNEFERLYQKRNGIVGTDLNLGSAYKTELKLSGDMSTFRDQSFTTLFDSEQGGYLILIDSKNDAGEYEEAHLVSIKKRWGQHTFFDPAKMDGNYYLYGFLDAEGNIQKQGKNVSFFDFFQTVYAKDPIEISVFHLTKP